MHLSLSSVEMRTRVGKMKEAKFISIRMNICLEIWNALCLTQMKQLNCITNGMSAWKDSCSCLIKICLSWITFSLRIKRRGGVRPCWTSLLDWALKTPSAFLWERASPLTLPYVLLREIESFVLCTAYSQMSGPLGKIFNAEASYFAWMRQCWSLIFRMAIWGFSMAMLKPHIAMRGVSGGKFNYRRWKVTPPADYARRKRGI